MSKKKIVGIVFGVIILGFVGLMALGASVADPQIEKEVARGMANQDFSQYDDEFKQKTEDFLREEIKDRKAWEKDIISSKIDQMDRGCKAQHIPECDQDYAAWNNQELINTLLRHADNNGEIP